MDSLYQWQVLTESMGIARRPSWRNTSDTTFGGITNPKPDRVRNDPSWLPYLASIGRMLRDFKSEAQTLCDGHPPGTEFASFEIL